MMTVHPESSDSFWKGFRIEQNVVGSLLSLEKHNVNPIH